MKRLRIIKNNTVTNEAVMSTDSELDVWFEKHSNEGSFGPAGSFTVDRKDISEELNQERINREAEEYLSSTDKWVIRELETGIKTPQEIKDARKAAREKVKR